MWEEGAQWGMRRDDEDPGLPIKLGPASNGEYLPEPLSPVVTEAIRRAREECDRNARRLGMSRREFLLSICASAVTLSALDACTGEAARRPPGGRYRIPAPATTEPEAAHHAIGGEEFVLDVQGHLLEYDLNPAAHAAGGLGSDFWNRFPQQGCGESDPRVCFDIEHFMSEIFLKSDTNMVVLSALPIAPAGSALSPKIMEETRVVAERLCHDERVLLHAQVLPNVGPLRTNLDEMERHARAYPIKAWKVFTHYPDLYLHNGQGWRLDDRGRGVPKVGDAFIRKAIELGVPIIASHKGLSGGSLLASPDDVGGAARTHPDAKFLVYHSGFETSITEGPYSMAAKTSGVNRLITTMRENGIGPNGNVYAELGSTWWYLMRTPDQAAHVLGKLLKYVGEDNVIWGTDSIFYGSPQDQIHALRAFEITKEYQDRYGYPELTRELKAKILGLNGAKLYGVDPVSVPCTFTRRDLERIRRSLPGSNRTLGPATASETATFVASHQGWPG